MQVTFNEAAPLLQSATLKELQRIGVEPSGEQITAYVRQRFDEKSRTFLTTELLRDKVVAELRPLGWDSKIYGKSLGALSFFSETQDSLSEPGLYLDLVAEVQNRARADGMEMLVSRLGIDRLPWIQALEKRGFQVMDVQCPLVRQSVDSYPEPVLAKSSITVRLFEPGDLKSLGALAKEAFGRSHLYADSRLPAAPTDQLHEEWTRNDCLGRACFVFVAFKDEKIAGCVAGLWDDSQESLLGIRHGHIDLIAVKSDARRAGVAGTLMAQAMHWYRKAEADVVTVSTQGSNLAAISLYQRLGFSLQGLEITLHGWLDDSKFE